MLVLGVDIAARKGGKNCGLALIDASRLTSLAAPSDDLIWTRAIDGTDLGAVAAVVAEVKAYGDTLIMETTNGYRPAGAMLALERQYVGMDPAMTEKLITSRVRFEVVAHIRRVPFELYNPMTWQTLLTELLGVDYPLKVAKPRKVKALKRGAPARPAQPELPDVPAKMRMIKDTKAAARLLVSRLYPGTTMGPDECDALCLARYAAWKLRTA